MTRRRSSPNSKRRGAPGSQNWEHRIHAWLTDQRRLGKSDGYTITASGETIAAAVGTYRRQVMLSMRKLEQREQICTTRWFRKDIGGDGPHKITLLPLSREKREWVYGLAAAIDRTPGETIMILDALLANNTFRFAQLTLEELTGITGYPDALRLAQALIAEGFIKDDRIAWS